MNNRIKKICLITTSHLTSNPRLVKEAIALETFGFDIHIVFTQNLHFLVSHDDIILNDHPNWKYDVLNICKENKETKYIRLKHRLLQKVAKSLLYFFSENVFLHKLGLNKNYNWQKKKAIAANADLYIGHNLGALPVAHDSAVAVQAKSGFDAEDFHRAEGDSESFKNQAKSIVLVEDHYLRKVNYLSAASPLIAERYSQLFNRKVTTILNVFPKTTNRTRNNIDQPLKLFWFSQTIGSKRGLENVLSAVNSLPFEVEVHLLGNVDDTYKTELTTILSKQKSKSLHFYKPIPGDEIFELCLDFDLGLALELTEPLNRDICLTNKIFTYLQTGLAIIASNTLAQAQFLKSHPQIGSIFENDDVEALAKLLTTFNTDRVLLNKFQDNAFKVGQEELNWEKEKLKFLEVVNQVLNEHSKNKKICLITPSHISSNPRLVKEAIAFEKAGYKIHLVLTQNLPYLIDFDQKILGDHPSWTFDALNVSKSVLSSRITTYKNLLLQRVVKFFSNYLPTHKNLQLSANRNFYWQKKKAIQSKADLFIAHNVGALAVAYEAAHETSAKCGFDAEDFHRGERDWTSDNKEISWIEGYYLPKVQYITAASPLIAKEYEQIFNRKIEVILNVFPTTHIIPKNQSEQSLKLFWFSQTVGPKRGLENIMLALRELDFDTEFHILGNVTSSYKNILLAHLPKEKQSFVHFHPPIMPDEIPEMCTHFDIGIASEPGFSKNNNCALSNKIFNYLQSGLAILASDTDAQSEFLNTFSEIGILYKKDDPKSLITAITTYHLNRKLLATHRQNAYRLGQTTLNWDIEQEKIVEIVNQVLSSQLV